MRKQQQIWHDEHANIGTLPPMANTEPSKGVVNFTDYLAEQSVNLFGRAVDIGSGKGRNSIHLAKLGFEVWGLEYIESAIEIYRKLAEANGVEGRIHFELAEIDKHWEFKDDFFDVAVDSFSSIDIETKEGREIYRDEMHRTLKQGGYALVGVCSADDDWEKELIKNHPGPEKNSTLWPQNGKFQKDYDEEELREFYNIFEIVELKKTSGPVVKLGRKGIATNLWLILRK
ncbi:MAG: class I SAM-dependent methyltransferase [Candidatus Microsaccharimonas sp.]